MYENHTHTRKQINAGGAGMSQQEDSYWLACRELAHLIPGGLVPLIEPAIQEEVEEVAEKAQGCWRWLREPYAGGLARADMRSCCTVISRPLKHQLLTCSICGWFYFV